MINSKSINCTLFVSILVLFLNSCSNRNDDPSPDGDETLRKKVIGTWIQTKGIYQKKKPDGSPDGDRNIEEERYKTGEYQVKFEGGKYFETYPYGIEDALAIDSATYSIANGTLTLNTLIANPSQTSRKETRVIKEEAEKLILVEDNKFFYSEEIYKK